MKILQISPFVAPVLGGSAIAPGQLSRELERRGHEVTVATTDFGLDEPYAQTLSECGTAVLVFPHRFDVGSFLFSPSMKDWLRVNIAHFDIIHLHNFRSYQNGIAHRYARDNGIPYVLQAHGSVLPFFQKRLQKKLYDLIWGQRILGDAARVIALTATEADQYKKMGVEPGRIEVVPNGIDISEYANLPRKGQFKGRHDIPADERIVLFLGRLHRIKGIDLLVSAFAKLLKVTDNVKLVIIGPDDGVVAALKRQTKDLRIESSVLFVGPLYDRDKIEAYVDADIFVLPSVYETFPLAVLEASACGTPVIVTAECGIADLVKKFGCVVDRDSDALCAALCRILSSDNSRKNFGQKGRQFVTEQMSWKKAVESFEQVYCDAICLKRR